jgi:AcrR family transcriptional regulator
MNEKDLRVVKTRENIENTFLDLLGKKDFSRITVAELISTCRISKGTFYYHYQDKYALAESILRKQIATYDEIISNAQATIAGGTAQVEDLVDSFMDIAHVFHRLSTIRTSEFDAKDEFTAFLQKKCLVFMKQWGDLNIKNPFQVSRLLAAIVLAEMEMLASSQAKVGLQFIETLQELAALIRKLTSQANS